MLLVSITALAFIWAATEWTSWTLGFQPGPGHSWFEVFIWLTFHPLAFFWWWLAYDANPPQVFARSYTSKRGIVAYGCVRLRGPQEKVDFSPGKNQREFFSDLYILDACQMPLLKCGENSPNSRPHCECFPFAPEAVKSGPALDRDIAIFYWLCAEVGLPPSAPMLLLAGDEYARQLFLRRAATKPDWAMFMATFGKCYPDIMTKRVAAEEAVRAIPTGCPGWKSTLTVPEIVLGWHLLNAVPAGMGIRRDQPLPKPVAARLWRADYVVSTSQCTVWIEMAGMLDEAGQAQTTNALRYLNRQPDRMRAYEAAGLNPPVTVFAGELFGATRREKMLKRILGSIVV